MLASGDFEYARDIKQRLLLSPNRLGGRDVEWAFRDRPSERRRKIFSERRHKLHQSDIINVHCPSLPNTLEILEEVRDKLRQSDIINVHCSSFSNTLEILQEVRDKLHKQTIVGRDYLSLAEIVDEVCDKILERDIKLHQANATNFGRPSYFNPAKTVDEASNKFLKHNDKLHQTDTIRVNHLYPVQTLEEDCNKLLERNIKLHQANTTNGRWPSYFDPVKIFDELYNKLPEHNDKLHQTNPISFRKLIYLDELFDKLFEQAITNRPRRKPNLYLTNSIRVPNLSYFGSAEIVNEVSNKLLKHNNKLHQANTISVRRLRNFDPAKIVNEVSNKLLEQAIAGFDKQTYADHYQTSNFEHTEPFKQGNDNSSYKLLERDGKLHQTDTISVRKFNYFDPAEIVNEVSDKPLEQAIVGFGKQAYADHYQPSGFKHSELFKQVIGKFLQQTTADLYKFSAIGQQRNKRDIQLSYKPEIHMSLLPILPVVSVF